MTKESEVFVLCFFYTSVRKDQVSFGIDNLKVGLHIFVVSEYQNSPLKWLETEEHNSNKAEET